ncbi:MAG TPA: asparaginase [Sphingomonadales bacterium]
MTVIGLMTLGGTIAMRDRGDGARPADGPEELLRNLGLADLGLEVAATEICNRPSGHLAIADIYALLPRIRHAFASGARGLVITQGTDTLEETAFILDLLLPHDKNVVVTGAMRPASHLAPDGPANLRNALLAASRPELAGLGVLVAMNDCLFAARDVTKGHSQRADSFRSRDGAVVGVVEEGSVQIICRPAPLPTLPLPDRAEARVPILVAHLGDDGMAARILGTSGIDGLVIEGFGGGRVSPGLADALGELAAVMPVVVATRCTEGATNRATYGYAGGEMDLRRRGVIHAGSLAGVKARAALAVLLDGGAGMAEIRAFFRDL